MEIKFQTRHILFIILGIILIIGNFVYFWNTRWFKPTFVISLLIMSIQFLIDYFAENRRQQEIETKFMEFVRALVGTVKSGISIPKAVIQISNEDYGALNPYVKKIAAQLEWGFPLNEALETFAKDANNKVINKAVYIVIEAEKSGGDMTEVLNAVSSSVYSIKKIKEERKSSVYSQIVEGYIIFFMFIGIMLIMQVYLMPKISSLSTEGLGEMGSVILPGMGGQVQNLSLDTTFTWMTIIQGLFAGLLIGKFSEGEIKYGIKHSLILVIIGYLIISTVTGV